MASMMVSRSNTSASVVNGRERRPPPSSAVPVIANRGIVRCLAVLSQARGKVPYLGPEGGATDLKELIVPASVDGQEGHRPTLASGLREAPSHGKGHESVLGPMCDEDRAPHLANLTQVVEALPDE